MLSPVPAAYEAHFQPQHHRVPVEADWADWHTRATLVARLRKAGNVWGYAFYERLTIQRLDLNLQGKRRTRGKTFIAANARRQFLRYL